MTVRVLGLGGIVLAIALGCGGAPTPVAPKGAEVVAEAESLPTTAGAATWSAMEAIAGQCECVVARIELYESAVFNDVDGKPTAKPRRGPDLATCSSVDGRANEAPAPPRNVVLAMDASPTKTSSELFEIVAKKGASKSTIVMASDGAPQWKSASPKSRRGREVAASPDVWRGAEEINKRLAVIGTAFRSAQLASQTCHALILGAAMDLELGERHGGSGFTIVKERASSRRALAAASRADALAAASLGLIASYEAAVATGEGRVLDRTAHALADALPTEGRVSDADVDALWTTAKARANDFDAKVKTWTKREEDRVRSIGHDTLDAESAPVLGQSDASMDSKIAVAGLFLGDVGMATRGAALVYPADAPVVHGLLGSSAVTKGDYRAALTSALKMVPADSKMGVALMLSVREILPLKPR